MAYGSSDVVIVFIGEGGLSSMVAAAAGGIGIPLSLEATFYF